MSATDDVDAISRLALGEIDRIEKKLPPSPFQNPYKYTEDRLSQYRPSSQTSGSVSVPLISAPRNYYRSSSAGYAETGANYFDVAHKRILNSVYRREVSPEDTTPADEIVVVTNKHAYFEGARLGMVKPVLVRQDRPKEVVRGGNLSQDMKVQVFAIILNSIIKMIATLFASWARDNRVPYEIL